MRDVDKLIKILRGEIGYHEGRSGGHWNNIEKYAAEVPILAWANGQPWCDVFVAWAFTKAGLAHLIPISASCDVSRAEWKKRGRWSEYPCLGGQIIYGTPSDAQHTGVVVAFDATTVTTVEGNTNTSGSSEGDGVYLKVHQRRDPWIQGYGYPEFAEGVVSADPAYAHKAPAPATPGTPVDKQTAQNIESGQPVSKVKRPRVAARMRQIIQRLRAGKEK